MTLHLAALCLDAIDPELLSRFWAGLLGRELAADGSSLLPVESTGFRLEFEATSEPKSGPNQLHLHLTSDSLEHQQSTVARALALGGRHLDVGQRPEEGHVVLADPEGNEFCVIEPGNAFLADCGFLAELACDGSQEVGYFWRDALGWPLVWDQDQETAIQSPSGGTKIAWGGPPVRPKSGRNRWHVDLAPPAGEDLHAEVDRLVSLRANRADGGRAGATRVELTDPDGNEFCVRTVGATRTPR
ncbi:VOC family protein [Pengzhenrongella sicca]|uniref:VOC family protein n=1 Tax=Pengzhenrongella sicca TaxID=2819238 RepID=A0A8A4ZCB3_9MICO|nr:VOC family protein [Pengzhenrongella sicca]QTE28513.1 VOC family protein [Pengzhenrongella sicca]